MHGTRVWRRFQKTFMGKVVNFKIQEMPKTLNEEALKMMGKDFFIKEPFSIGSGINKTKESREEMNNLWRTYALPQNLSIVCLKDEETNLNPEIIAVNFLTLSLKDNKKFHLPAQPELFVKIYKHIDSQCNVFDLYNVDKYLSAFGLCVNEAYRGLGVGTQMLLTRDEVCKHLGLKVTSTLFSTPTSQRTAEKAGFETIKEVKFSDIERDLNVKFPDECDVAKMMAKTMR